jgi:hypothetical protein
VPQQLEGESVSSLYPKGTLATLRGAHEGLSLSISQLHKERGLIGYSHCLRNGIVRFMTGLELADHNLIAIIEKIESEDF